MFKYLFLIFFMISCGRIAYDDDMNEVCVCQMEPVVCECQPVSCDCEEECSTDTGTDETALTFESPISELNLMEVPQGVENSTIEEIINGLSHIDNEQYCTGCHFCRNDVRALFSGNVSCSNERPDFVFNYQSKDFYCEEPFLAQRFLDSGFHSNDPARPIFLKWLNDGCF